MPEPERIEENDMQENDGGPRVAPGSTAESLWEAAVFMGRLMKAPGMEKDFTDYARELCLKLLEDFAYLALLEMGGLLKPSGIRQAAAKRKAQEIFQSLDKAVGDENTRLEFEAMLAEFEPTTPEN